MTSTPLGGVNDTSALRHGRVALRVAEGQRGHLPELVLENHLPQLAAREPQDRLAEIRIATARLDPQPRQTLL